MKVRYTGTQPTAFQAPVGTVEPGAEFEVPPGQETAYLQHGEIEEVKATTKTAKTEKTAEAPAE